jgi:hypothetical protein
MTASPVLVLVLVEVAVLVIRATGACAPGFAVLWKSCGKPGGAR